MVVNLNRRIEIVVFGATQNDMGGNVATEIDSWPKWAHIDQRSGFNVMQNDQNVWPYDYKVIMRHERTRPTKSNYEIRYEGYRLKINSISIDDEGYKGYEIARCSKVDEVITQETSS